MIFDYPISLNLVFKFEKISNILALRVSENHKTITNFTRIITVVNHSFDSSQIRLEFT